MCREPNISASEDIYIVFAKTNRFPFILLPSSKTNLSATMYAFPSTTEYALNCCTGISFISISSTSEEILTVPAATNRFPFTIPPIVTRV